MKFNLFSFETIALMYNSLCFSTYFKSIKTFLIKRKISVRMLISIVSFNDSIARFGSIKETAKFFSFSVTKSKTKLTNLMKIKKIFSFILLSKKLLLI